MKIIFIGTNEFGRNIFEGLCQSGLNPSLVITAPDRPVGRNQVFTPPKVKAAALERRIEVLQPDRIKDAEEKIASLQPDLVIVADYGQIIPKEILEMPKKGSLNVHPSILPKHRGASPVQHSILEGDEETGVTIILMDEKTDHGPVLASRKITIPGTGITQQELLEKLSDLACDLVFETIPKWMEGIIDPVPQKEDQATFTKILSKEDGRIDWKKPALEIERKVRAFDPWPGAFSEGEIKGVIKKIKILKSFVLAQTKAGPFGESGKTYLAPNEKIAVQTGKDFLVIEKMQVEGKNPVETKDFLKGNTDFIGKIFK